MRSSSILHISDKLTNTAEPCFKIWTLLVLLFQPSCAFEAFINVNITNEVIHILKFHLVLNCSGLHIEDLFTGDSLLEKIFGHLSVRFAFDRMVIVPISPFTFGCWILMRICKIILWNRAD